MCESRYNKLINNPTYAYRAYKYITKPWLSHIQYLLGKGEFTFRGWAVTQVLRVACIGAYMLNYKKSKKRKKSLKGINVMGVYKRLVGIIEKERAYA